MKYLLILALGFVGCASNELAKRTKYSDPVMRVLIDPNTINGEEYAPLINSLVTQGKFIVIDRASGFNALLEEQNRQHEESTGERFDDREKYAQVGKLFGVGGIIIAHSACDYYRNWGAMYRKCDKSLQIINASTGEIIAVSTDKSESEEGMHSIAPWDGAVEKLAENFPKRFERDMSTKELIDFKDSIDESKKPASE